jgi:hypothetical protein
MPAETLIRPFDTRLRSSQHREILLEKTSRARALSVLYIKYREKPMRVFVCAIVAALFLQFVATPCLAVTAFVAKQQKDSNDWQKLISSGEPCDSSKTLGSGCAAAAIALASQQCSTDSRFFQRQKIGYSRFSLFLILLSAGFTGVGASSTIANAKIYSTLGGTTGIGAATTAVNSDATADQNSLSAISTAIGKLEALGSSYDGTANGAAKVLLQAPAIASECDAAAGTSPAASKPAP